MRTSLKRSKWECIESLLNDNFKINKSFKKNMVNHGYFVDYPAF